MKIFLSQLERGRQDLYIFGKAMETSITRCRTIEKVSLIDASIFDTSTLADLHSECLGDYASAEIYEKFIVNPKTKAIMARVSDHQAAGFCVFNCIDDEAEVIYLGVKPLLRRRGIGKQIMEGTCNRVRLMGAKQIFLEVAESNLSGLRLYQSTHYKPVGRRSKYYGTDVGEKTDAIIMRRML